MMSIRYQQQSKRRTWLMGLLLCFILSAGIVPTQARELLRGDRCHVPEDSVIDGTLFVLCETLYIDGSVNGNVIGLALRGAIRGTVAGDVYLAGGQLDVQGSIGQNMHYLGGVLRIMPPEISAMLLPPEGNTDEAADDDLEGAGDVADDAGAIRATIAPVEDAGRVGGDLLSATLSSRLYDEAQLLGGVLAIGYQFINDGTIEDEVSFWGSTMRINGRINNDVYADVGDPASDAGQIETLLLPFQLDVELRSGGMIVDTDAVVRGELIYTAPAEGIIEGRIIRGVSFTKLVSVVLPTLEEPASITLYFEQFAREATTLLSIGFLMLFVAPSLIQPPLSMMRARFVPSVIVGMLSFIISFPVILIMLVLTVIVLILLEVVGLHGVTVAAGVVLALLNLGGISIFYFMAIFIARALVGLALGRLFMRWFLPAHQHRLSLQILTGTLVLALAVSLPIVGLIFNAFALFLGLGAVLTLVLDKLRQIRDDTPQSTPYTTASAVTRPRPVMPYVPIVHPVPRQRDDDVPTLPSAGMRDLPDGFQPDWFFDGDADDDA